MSTPGAAEDLISAATEIKNVYDEAALDDMYRTDDRFVRDLQRTERKPSGGEGYLNWGLSEEGSWSVGITADNASFPAPKDPTRSIAKMQPVDWTYTVQLGLMTTKILKGKKSTFFDGGIVADRVEGATKQTKAYRNRVYVGTNRGRLAIVSADGSSTFTAGYSSGAQGSRLIEVGMDLEASSSHSSPSIRDSFSNHRVTANNKSTQVVTYVKASDLTTDDRTLVAGDSVYITGTSGKLPYTLPDIVDDGTNCATLFTLTRSAHPKTYGIVKSNGGVLRQLTEPLILEAISDIGQAVNKTPNVIVSNDGQVRALLEDQSQDRRIMFQGTSDNSTVKYPLGFDENTFRVLTPNGNVVWKIYKDCAPRELYLLCWDTFFIYEGAKLGWVDGDGQMLKLIPGDGRHKAGYVAYMSAIDNMGNTMPCANAVIRDSKDRLCGDVS